MCHELFGDLEGNGLVYELSCADPTDRVSHLMDWLELAAAAPDDNTVLRRVLDAFCLRARVVVIEPDYFDIDYRSEFSATFTTAFDAQYFGIGRLHFFSLAPNAIPEVRYLRDFVAEVAEAIGQGEILSGSSTAEPRNQYLGYMVLRPQLTGSVGRSVVTPTAEIQILKETTPAERLIRTIASEPVHLFGIPLLAIGVPFMEQDGHLLRCAHVSVWICHYSAWMRGHTRRRTTGYIHVAGSQADPGRTYPSSGLSLRAMQAVLDGLGLPPEVGDVFGLSKPRHRFTWADRRDLRVQIQELEDRVTKAKQVLTQVESRSDVSGSLKAEQMVANRVVEDASAQLNKRWIHENLTAMICRYLNSSSPTILVREAERHAQVVVGYVRNEDRSNPLDGSPSAVTAFIVSDDSGGPFETVEVEDIVDEVARGETTPVTPLPRSLWLTGDFAERSAIAWFSKHAQAIRSFSDMRTGPEFDSFAAAVCDDELDKLTIRSYWTHSVDFKIDIADNSRFGKNPEIVRAIGEKSMPKYIWVSEAIDRKLRESGQPAVVGTLAISGAVVGLEAHRT